MMMADREKEVARRLAAMSRARDAYRQAERELFDCRERTHEPGAKAELRRAEAHFKRCMERLWRAERQYVVARERVRPEFVGVETE